MVEEAIAKHVKYDTSATENISKNIEFILESVNSKIFIADKDTLREYIERSNMYIPEDKYEKVNVFIGEKLFTASDENAAISSKVYSGYDRVDAVNYALQYCGTYLAGTNSAGYNTSSYPVYSSTSNADADCANFVSQCLKAGGMQEVGSDYTRADNWFCNTTSNTNLPAVALTWRGAVYFPKYWETRNVGYNEIDTSTVNLYSDYEDDVYDVLNRGDVVQLCDDDYRPIHTLIITSYSYSGAVPDLLYSALTVNRKKQPLQGAFYGYDTVRFYRFYN